MRRLLVVIAVLAGCYRNAAGPSLSATDAAKDALWARAPEDAIYGLVAAPGALAMLDTAWHRVHAYLRTFPQFEPYERELTRRLAELGLSGDLDLAELGLAADRGLAVFRTQRGTLAFLPVADRERFLARTRGTKGDPVDHVGPLACRVTGDSYYACATRADLLDHVLDHLVDHVADHVAHAPAGGSLRSDLGSLGARGDLELIAREQMPVAAALELQRGGFVLHATIARLPVNVSALAPSPVAPGLDASQLGGFVVVNLAPLLSRVPARPIVPGVSTADLARSLAGPVTLAIAAGSMTMTVRVPLRETGPARTVVEHCAEIPGAALLSARTDAQGCHVSIPFYGWTMDLAVEHDTLRLATSGLAPATTAPPGALGHELATGTWHAAAWGRGSLLGKGFPLPRRVLDELGPEDATLVRAVVMVSELGFGARLEGRTLHVVLGARTAWSNPDPIVAQLQAVTTDDLVSDRRDVVAAAIAKSAPDSPVARDLRAGPGGLVAPLALFGVVSAVAIPVFLDYLKRSRSHSADSPVEQP
jgi:hypothetical protein